MSVTSQNGHNDCLFIHGLKTVVYELLASFARAPPSLPASLSPSPLSLHPRRGVKKMYRFSRHFMKFPGLLIFDPLKLPPPPTGGLKNV